MLMIWRAERNVRKRTKTSQIEWCCEASFNRNSNFTVLEFLINKRMVLTRNPPWTEGFILVMCEKRLYQPNWRTKFSHRYYFIFSLKGLDLSGKSLELFTTSQALFWKDSGFSESTNIVLNHIRKMKYSSMIFVVKQ